MATETSWAISANCVGIVKKFPIKYGSAFKPVPGYDLKVLSSEGKENKAGQMGDIVVKLPLPPGTFPTLWNADERYKKSLYVNL